MTKVYRTVTDEELILEQLFEMVENEEFSKETRFSKIWTIMPTRYIELSPKQVVYWYTKYQMLFEDITQAKNVEDWLETEIDVPERFGR